jgi:hypothetical protein
MENFSSGIPVEAENPPYYANTWEEVLFHLENQG